VCRFGKFAGGEVNQGITVMKNHAPNMGKYHKAKLARFIAKRQRKLGKGKRA